jgi:hypothetical protein
VYVLYFSNSLSSVQVTENLFHFSSFLASRRRFRFEQAFFFSQTNNQKSKALFSPILAPPDSIFFFGRVFFSQ